MQNADKKPDNNDCREMHADFNKNKSDISYERNSAVLQDKKSFNFKLIIFSISLALHILVFLVIGLGAVLFGNINPVKKIPEFIEVIDYEEYVPPPEENIQVVKKMKIEEDTIPDNDSREDEENNTIRANPDGDENAKVLSQMEGDNGTVDYLPQSKIDHAPVFPLNEIKAKVVYPPLANKQGIEGLVILDLYIDSTGVIRKTVILKDPGYGFGEAALKAMEDIKCIPAKSNGISVAVKFRYPIRFTLGD